MTDCESCGEPSDERASIFKAHQQDMWNKAITFTKLGLCAGCGEMGSWYGVRDRPGVILCPPCFADLDSGISNPKSVVEPQD